MATMERIDSDFTWHPPKDGQPERYEAIRSYAKGLGALFARSDATEPRAAATV